jgi:head-tail adaptor
MVAELVAQTVAAVPEDYFPSLATIQAKTVTRAPSGQEIEAWADVGGLVGISAAKAPLTAIERQAAGYTATDQAWHVLLKGAYPTTTTRHRAVIDGVTHDIDAVETDQTSTVTRLRVRTVGT